MLSPPVRRKKGEKEFHDRKLSAVRSRIRKQLYQNQHRNKRREQDLCPLCGKPTGGFYYCPKHRQRDREYRQQDSSRQEKILRERQRRQSLTDQGLCHGCKSPNLVTKTYCQKCRRKHNLRSKLGKQRRNQAKRELQSQAA